MSRPSNFGLPAPVIAEILSFTAHPGEIEFDELRNISPAVARAVEKFAFSFNRDPLLMIANSEDTELNGKWFLIQKGTHPIDAPRIPGLPDGYLDFSTLGRRTVYQFGKEDLNIFIITKTMNVTELIPQSRSEGVVLSKSIVTFFDIANKLDFQDHETQMCIIGRSHGRNDPRRTGVWYSIENPKSERLLERRRQFQRIRYPQANQFVEAVAGGLPGRFDLQRFAEAKVAWVHKMIAANSNLSPEVRAQPLNPEVRPQPLNPEDEEWNSMRIAVFWPDHKLYDQKVEL